MMGNIENWMSKVCFDFDDPVDTMTVVKKLKAKRNLKKMRYEMNFKQFFLSNYSKSFYKRFCWANGYTDFENADIIDTLYDYGFDDNISGTTLFSVPWNQLIHYLKSKLKKTKIQRCREMMSYSYDCKEGVWKVVVRSTLCGKTYVIETKKLVIAGYLASQLRLEDQIGCNVFLRYYTYERNRSFSKCLMKGQTEYRTDNFQKRIRISDTIEMTSYSDGKNADSLYKTIMKKTEPKSGDEAIFYWKKGTHYYKPLEKKWKTREAFIKYAQNPFPKLFVVGEMVSRNQGWTEGAFESVERILEKLVRK
jgi:hypothetical protein